MSAQEQWYSNKDLYEQINTLRDEMKETRNLIKQYNGLREKVDNVETVVKNVGNIVETMQAEEQGKSKVFEGIRNWGGWIFALLSFVVLIMTSFKWGR